MGKIKSKGPKIGEELKNGDWKVVQLQDPTKVRYLKKWVRRYGFTGQLSTCRLTELQKSIKEKCGSDAKKMIKEGYQDVQFWKDMAKRREDGMRKKKEEVCAEEIGEVLFYRKEDDETGIKKKKQNQEEVDEEVLGAVGVEAGRASQPSAPNNLYPTIPISPPPYEGNSHRPPTRAAGPPPGDWSKTWGKMLSPNKAPEIKQLNPEMADTYPMIEVANPNAGEQGEGPTLLVFRTWTIEDVKKAVEGVTSHREDPERFFEDMENLRRSYHLNGNETQQAWMQAMGTDWHHVRGDWNPLHNDWILAHDAVELGNRVERLGGRVTARFRRRANYVEIGRIEQKEDELFDEYKIRMEKVFRTQSGLVDDGAENGVYRQQLKNALHAGSLENIYHWVQKYHIQFPTATLDDYISHALHAEKVTKGKKTQKGKTGGSEVFYHDLDEVLFQRELGGGIYRRRNMRGRGGRGRGQYRGWQNLGGRGCWSCGEEGHLARDCPRLKTSA